MNGVESKPPSPLCLWVMYGDPAADHKHLGHLTNDPPKNDMRITFCALFIFTTQDHKPGTMSLLDLPNELLIHLCDVLLHAAQKTPSRAECLNLINLAQTCRRFYNLAEASLQNHPNSKLTEKQKAHVSCKLGNQKAEEWMKTFTPLAAWARHVGKICAFCPHRARHYVYGEEGLPICHPCETLFPRRSLNSSECSIRAGNFPLQKRPLQSFDQHSTLRPEFEVTFEDPYDEVCFLWKHMPTVRGNLYKQKGEYEINTETLYWSAKKLNEEQCTDNTVIEKYNYYGGLPYYLEFRYQFDPWWHDNKSPTELYNEFRQVQGKWSIPSIPQAPPWQICLWSTLPQRKHFGLNEQEERKRDEQERRNNNDACAALRRLFWRNRDLIEDPEKCLKEISDLEPAKRDLIATCAWCGW
jgi:hypothetical protein